MQGDGQVGFVRIKPIQCERSVAATVEQSTRADDDDQLFDPFIAVKVLDAESVPGEIILQIGEVACDRVTVLFVIVCMWEL